MQLLLCFLRLWTQRQCEVHQSRFFSGLPKHLCAHKLFALHSVHPGAPALGCMCGHASPGHAEVSAGSTADHCNGIVVVGKKKIAKTGRTQTDPAKRRGMPPLPSRPVVVLFFIREFVSVAVATVSF